MIPSIMCCLWQQNVTRYIMNCILLQLVHFYHVIISKATSLHGQIWLKDYTFNVLVLGEKYFDIHIVNEILIPGTTWDVSKPAKSVYTSRCTVIKECSDKVEPMFRHLFEEVAGMIGLFCFVLRILVGLNYEYMKFHDCQMIFRSPGSICVWHTPISE